MGQFIEAQNATEIRKVPTWLGLLSKCRSVIVSVVLVDTFETAPMHRRTFLTALVFPVSIPIVLYYGRELKLTNFFSSSYYQFLFLRGCFLLILIGKLDLRQVLSVERLNLPRFSALCLVLIIFHSSSNNYRYILIILT